MTDLRQWDKLMNRQLAEVKEAVKEKHAEIASMVFNYVHEFSPLYSGYYAANHRISFDGAAGFELSPQKRGGNQGAYFGRVETERLKELQKLSRKDLPEVITLGTAVPYAIFLDQPFMGQSAVSPKTGNRPVYLNARMRAVEDFSSGRK